MGHVSTIGHAIKDITGKFFMLLVGATAASRASNSGVVDGVAYDPYGPPKKKPEERGQVQDEPSASGQTSRE
ncbi:hypothetical protein QBC36DRAFT_238020 [Triangularia setosa]|uniref:Uncharacterized protein n=1 Tax=Triangularia setosa TaxID=2587417 RepID=A0AAN6WA61_9PEZI|nr:hypothetical protein QBC36DRAFT_238020 [Podospora setosa]